MTDTAIRTEHLTKVYSGRVIALNDLNLIVPAGAVYGLLGPNGAGKTTTLRLLLGLQRPTAGRAWVFGNRCGSNAVDVRQLIGFLPTHPRLPGHLRPVEYLDLLGKLYRLPSQVRKPKLTSLLRAVGLLNATNQRIQTFSTGMRTRLGIAASLLADPPLLLWDEPTAGLDPAARRFTLDLIRELAHSRTIVVATHILSDIDQVCDHVGVMHEGQMIFSGTMEELKRHLRRDDAVLELAGEPAAVAKYIQESNGSDACSLQLRGTHHVAVQIADGADRAGVLAKLLIDLKDHGLSLKSLRSGASETEDAYLHLLQEDQAHGFRRFDFQAAGGSDAGASDLSL